jgi:RimJ/RimL family protein N-acetyltransferase
LLKGKNIILRSFEKKDMKRVSEIFNDPKVNQFDLNFRAGFSHEFMEKEYDDELKEALKDTGNDGFIIENLNGEAAGELGYWRSRNARNIYMIGISIGSDYWSCGYGQDAITTLLKYLFLSREAVKVELIVRETNPRAIRCYEKCGFVKEVYLRDSDFAGGKTLSYHYMGVLKEEFLARGDF